MRRLLAVVILVAMASAAVPDASAAHRPLYKAGYDYIPPAAHEAHFVWLRSDFFNFMGEVWWQAYVHGPGRVEILFLDFVGFGRFRDGVPFEPLLRPQVAEPSGSQWISGLTADLPYFLVFRNAGDVEAEVEWTIFAEVDWRRWQGQPPGPSLNLTVDRRSPPLFGGDRWEASFHEPRVYIYNCHPHIDMTAILEVLPSAEPGGLVDIAIHDMGFHPEVVRVPVGTTVRWTNFDGMEHSVELRVLEGGFVVPNPAAPAVAWFAGGLAVAAIAGVSLYLRRKRIRAERDSKADGESDRNKDK